MPSLPLPGQLGLRLVGTLRHAPPGVLLVLILVVVPCPALLQVLMWATVRALVDVQRLPWIRAR